MKLPTQAKSVDRTNRIGEAKKANISPAGSVFDALKQVRTNALKGVMGQH